jgi:uncharacterized protein YdaU (DUF1376 family)
MTDVSLQWFPVDAAQWMLRTAKFSVEAKAAYMDLRCHAWLAIAHGDAPCTLPADDAQLARLTGLGARWKKVGAELLPLFERVGDRYLDRDLLATWNEQQAKHAKVVERASAGGKAKAARKHRFKQGTGTAASTATSTPQAVLDECSSSAELELEGAAEQSLTAHALLAPAPNGARSGDGPPRAAGVKRSAPPEPSADELALVAAYYRWLGEQTDEFAAGNPDEFAQLEREERARMGFRPAKPLSAFEQRALRERLMCRAQERNHWPDEATWIADRIASGEMQDLHPSLSGAMP